jgi:hypothetical protein
MAATARDQPTDRFQFDSLNGPPLGASKSQSEPVLSLAQASMRGTSSATSGTVRARLPLSVSTASSPPDEAGHR